MFDYFQLVLFGLVPLGIYFGLRRLSRPRKISDDEYAGSLKRSGSAVTAGVNALNKVFNPSDAKGKVEIEKSVMTETESPHSRDTGSK